MKKVVVSRPAYFLSTLLVLAMILIGCSSNETSQENTESQTNEAPETTENSEPAAEDSYPSKDIHVTIPYSAGGGNDTLARTVAPTLEEILGQSIIISNVTGAGGEIGTTAVAKSEADGYNLGVLGFPDNVIIPLYRETEYSNDDFEYLASFTASYAALISSKDSPFETLEDLIAYAKENPGGVTIAVSGDAHVYGLLALEKAAGIDLTPIMNNSGGESLNSILGGHVHAAILAQQFAGQAEDQGVPTLALFAPERIESMSHIPTFSEFGYDIQVVSPRVFALPAGTPEDVVNTLIEAFDKASENEELKKAIIATGELYEYRSGSELKEWLNQHIETIESNVKGNEDAFRR